MKDLASHILDIVQNSVRARASEIEITVAEHREKDLLAIEIKDNGEGMSSNVQKQIFNPFFTTRSQRDIGLGIPLLKQRAEQAGGELRLTSQKEAGTTVYAEFKLSHWDCPPLGEIAETVSLLITAYPDIQVVYKHQTDNGKYSIDTCQAKQMYPDSTNGMFQILRNIQAILQQNLENIEAYYFNY